MPPIAVDRWYDEIEASTETLAGLVHGADLTRQVPTCPEWTLRQLATHVGRAQRWSAEVVSTRSAELIPFPRGPRRPDPRRPRAAGAGGGGRGRPPPRVGRGGGGGSGVDLRRAPAGQL